MEGDDHVCDDYCLPASGMPMMEVRFEAELSGAAWDWFREQHRQALVYEVQSLLDVLRQILRVTDHEVTADVAKVDIVRETVKSVLRQREEDEQS